MICPLTGARVTGAKMALLGKTRSSRRGRRAIQSMLEKPMKPLEWPEREPSMYDRNVLMKSVKSRPPTTRRRTRTTGSRTSSVGRARTLLSCLHQQQAGTLHHLLLFLGLHCRSPRHRLPSTKLPVKKGHAGLGSVSGVAVRASARDDLTVCWYGCGGARCIGEGCTSGRVHGSDDVHTTAS